MTKVISAGAIVFRKEEKQIKILLLYHGRSYWNFPKGKLESGERAMAAFLREVEEETGIKKNELRILPGFRVSEHYMLRGRKRESKEQVSKTVIFYLVETKKRAITVSHEHEGFGWFDYKDALRLVSHQNTKKMLEKAYGFIRQSISSHEKDPRGQSRNLR